MKSIGFITVLLFLCSYLHPAAARDARPINEYNLNLYNGLSSNNVYNVTADHLGYLWICTGSGLFRYNGYELRKYSLPDGLPNDDVWGTTLDQRQRLWLKTIAGSLGYIANGRYHRAYSDPAIPSFYPRSIYGYDKGIGFVHMSNDSVTLFCFEENDTLRLRSYPVSNIIANQDEVLSFHVSGRFRVYRLDPGGRLVYRRTVVMPEGWEKGADRSELFAGHLYMYSLFHPTNVLRTIDLRTGQAAELRFSYQGKEDHIMNIYRLERTLCIIGRYQLYTLDTDLHVTGRRLLSTLTNEGEAIAGRIAWVSDDPFWRQAIATRTHGLFINYGSARHFRPLPDADLSDYKCVGSLGDSIGYWWSMNSSTLLEISAAGRITRWPPVSPGIMQIAACNKDWSLVLGYKGVAGIYRLDHRRRQMLPERAVTVTPEGRRLFLHLRSMVVVDTGRIYVSGTDVYRCAIRGRELVCTQLDRDHRYYQMARDTARNGIWAYNNGSALFVSLNGGSLRLDASLYRPYGITNIEQLLPYRRGELLIKDNTGLYQIDLYRHTIRRRFRQYNLEQALFGISGDRLVLAGKFGMVFARIDEPDDRAVCYPNIKNALYYRALDMQVLGQNVLLSTDRGAYMVELPQLPAAGAADQAFPYRTVVTYMDTMYDVRRRSHFSIQPGNDRLRLDVINPRGNGRLRLSYYIPGADPDWQELSGNEIRLPKLAAGGRYALLVRAGDDVWNSAPIALSLYMVPLWWQTPAWQAIFWLGGIAVIIGLLLIVVVVTRNRVARLAHKRQYMTMLELRSIYAQLNPHFIFNTLNTALYFIRKKQIDDAAAHVTTFAQLLRSYIGSSRNRLIAVSDELTNLRNYITLQQKRFEHAFSFEVTTDERILEAPVYIPTLLVQPIVENAINHGLVPKGTGGWLKVHFRRREDGSVICTIDDNGIGRKKAQAMRREHASDHTSHGSRLIQELTDAFNRYEGMGIRITYFDKTEPHSGTLVTILIQHPYEKQPVHVPDY